MSPFTYYVGVICHLVSKHFVSRASVLDNTLDVNVRKRLSYHMGLEALCHPYQFQHKISRNV